MVKFNCPKCGNRLFVNDENAGKKGRCNKCGAVVAVPLADAVVGATQHLPPQPAAIPPAAATEVGGADLPWNTPNMQAQAVPAPAAAASPLAQQYPPSSAWLDNPNYWRKLRRTIVMGVAGGVLLAGLILSVLWIILIVAVRMHSTAQWFDEQARQLKP